MKSLNSLTAGMLAPFSSCTGQTAVAMQADPAQAPETAGRHGRKQEKKQQKIAAFFNRLEEADNKRGDPAKMRNFILKRQQLDHTKHALTKALEANPKNKMLIGWLQEKVKRQKTEVQKSYIEGPQGMSVAQLKEKRREQWKAASIEGLHTMFGARLFSAASGIVGAELSSAGSKVAFHQSLGYGTQSLASGLFRIMTEVPQIRMNKGGKPKLPSNLAATSNFKQNRREMEAARAALQTAAQSLRSAYDAAASNASDANLEALTRELEKLTQAVRHLAKFDSMYESLCIQLEREFRGKKASAVVSVLAGVMSGGTLAIDQSGTAAIVGHKLLCLGGLLLQGPASPFDYMDGNVDYPQKMSAKKIDLSLLIKPESRHKAVDALEDDDFDTAIAAKLYDEQPQLMLGVIRSVYIHKMGELNAKLFKLEREIEAGNVRPSLSGRVYSASPLALAALQREDIQKKKQTMERTRHEFEELKNQIVLFEQHQRDKLDPDGLIGKAITVTAVRISTLLFVCSATRLAISASSSLMRSSRPLISRSLRENSSADWRSDWMSSSPAHLGGRLTRRKSAAGSGASRRRRLTRSRRMMPRLERFGNFPVSSVASTLLAVLAAVRTIPVRTSACSSSRLIRSAIGLRKG